MSEKRKDVVEINYYLFKLLFVKLFLIISIFPYSIQAKNDFLRMKKDSVNNIVTFYLADGHVVYDSLSIANVDFKYEELKKVNDSLWTYRFYVSNRTFEDITYAQQIYILNNERKLRLAFVGILEYSNLDPNHLEGGYFWVRRYSVENMEDINSACIKYYRRTMDTFGGDTIYEETTDSVKLYFNEDHNIFYTHIDTLNGEYFLEKTEIKSDKVQSVWFQDEVVFSIDINISKYIYLHEKWFYVSGVDSRWLEPFASF